MEVRRASQYLGCKAYLAGPMRGYPQFNFPRFFEEAKRLRAKGYIVFNPAEHDMAEYGPEILQSDKGDLADIKSTGFSLRNSLAIDTNWICRHADVIALLPGWEKSKGATAEKALADALELEVIYL